MTTTCCCRSFFKSQKPNRPIFESKCSKVLWNEFFTTAFRINIRVWFKKNNWKTMKRNWKKWNESGGLLLQCITRRDRGSKTVELCHIHVAQISIAIFVQMQCRSIINEAPVPLIWSLLRRLPGEKINTQCEYTKHSYVQRVSGRWAVCF